ncbi:MAG: TAXI family TRAP transporter solute-binding subunit, partial [Burkholderiales bacterium]
IEDRSSRNDVPAGELLAELDRLEAKARNIAVPLSHTDELYELRSHIALVRARLQDSAPS